MAAKSSCKNDEDSPLWDPDHDWILQFEKILKGGKLNWQ